MNTTTQTQNLVPHIDSEGIFERSLSFSMSLPNSRQKLVRTLLNSSQFLTASFAIPSHHSTEDFIAPVLDTTTEILTNPELDPENVNIVCCRQECEDDDLANLECFQHQQHHQHHLQKSDNDAAIEDDTNPLSRSPTSSSTVRPKGPYKRRSRLRSRSLICNSLMLLMAPVRDTKKEKELNGNGSGAVHSSRLNTSLSLLHESNLAGISQRQAHHWHSTSSTFGSHSGSGSVSGNATSYSVPSLHVNLQNAAAASSPPGSGVGSGSGSGSTSGSKTINFYLFADVLETEKDPDLTLDSDMIESPTAGSPPQFKRFSFSEPLHHINFPNLHHHHNNHNHNYNHNHNHDNINTQDHQGDTIIEKITDENFDAANIQENGLPEDPIPDGFTSISMKDYIAKLT